MFENLFKGSFLQRTRKPGKKESELQGLSMRK